MDRRKKNTTSGEGAPNVAPNDLLRYLVENALDFLARSIAEFEGSPKYSVIHFHTATELFLKARLLAEHWSLVVSKKQEADWKKFIEGDFLSVTLDEAADRLDKIVRSGVSSQALAAFKKVARHRNKVMHFFHEAHSVGEKEGLRRSIAQEQLIAWLMLSRLLSSQWRQIFEPWAKEVAEVDKKFRAQREFLKVVYNDLRPQIKKRIDSGETVNDCSSCGFAAQFLPSELGEVEICECLVCNFRQTGLLLECPNCAATVEFWDQGISTCSSCGAQFEPDDVADLIANKRAERNATRDGDGSWDRGHCGACDGYETVVRVDDDRYVCACCLESFDFDSVQRCGWCNTLSTGNLEDSFSSGCGHCDGYLGHAAAKDD